MVEKIDVINNVVYVYDETFKQVKSIDLDTLEGLNLSYLDNCKMLTINLSQPIKRIVKFTELQTLETQASFVETFYENMTEQQSTDFDNFIEMIKSK